jgi:GNAT superfamily N-acetyltransferase
VLTELCLRSKAVWGYDETFIEACRDELALTTSAMRSSYLQVAETGAVLVGVAQVTVKGEFAELAKLFIEPTHLRRGAGKVLFQWAIAVAHCCGAVSMVIEADPSAVRFYRRMGAVDDGRAPSKSIPGRFIPRLKMLL